jgi:uncharacterized lipoprotein YbaY/heat shock protein HslJ
VKGVKEVKKGMASMNLAKNLVLLALVLAAPTLASGQGSKISGSVTYREKIALPPSAVLELRLEDVTRADATPVVMSVLIERPGQVPIRFELPLGAVPIDARGRYAVRATIKDGDRVLFTSLDTMLVLTQGHGTRADLVLTQVATPVPAKTPTVGQTLTAAGAATVRQATTAAAAASTAVMATVRPQAHPLPALPATFTGSYNCADCPKMQYQLNLYPDDSFFMRATVTDRQTTGTSDDIGSWVLSSDRTVLVLKGQGDALDMFTIGPNGSLKKVDISVKPLPGHLPNDLVHAAAFKPLTADLQTMRGAYSMTDRGAFVECSTGQRWLVANEGAAAELAAAYAKARPEPGASIVADIEGVATPAAEKSGGPSGSVVARKLIRLLPRESCAPRYANAPLAGTYWRLTSLGGQAVAAPTDPRRELSLNFQSTDDSYSGSSGCNRLLGTYTTTDTAITLTGAGTLVACKDLAQAESAFLNALKATRRYRISGQTLELFDAAGIRVARFSTQTAMGATRR